MALRRGANPPGRARAGLETDAVADGLAGQQAGVGGWAAVTGGAMVVALACAGLSGAVRAPVVSDAATGTLAAGSVLPGGAGQGGSGTSGSSSGRDQHGRGRERRVQRGRFREGPQGRPGHRGGLGRPRVGPGGLAPYLLPGGDAHRRLHLGRPGLSGVPAHPSQADSREYHDVGVGSVRWDISGARSVVEVLPGQVNGYNAAQAIYRSGFRGSG